MDYLVHIIRNLLSPEYRNNSEKITEVLLSDNAYPNALSIMRTLSYFGIETDAYRSDFEHLVQNKSSKIIHTTWRSGHFFLIKNMNEKEIVLFDGNEYTYSVEHFMKLWDGIVIIVNNVNETIDRQFSIGKWIKPMIIGCLLLLGFILCQNIEKGVQTVLDYIGFILSFFLFSKEALNYKTIPLCKRTNIFDCDLVSHSNPFPKKWHISLPLLGLFFFCYDYILILLNVTDLFLSITYVVTSVCALLLLAYQVFKIRRLCLFCASVDVIMIVKGVLAVYYNKLIFDISDLSKIMFGILASIIICSTLYNLFDLKTKNVNYKIDSLRIKRVAGLFNLLVSKEKTVNLPKSPALAFGSGKNVIHIDTFLKFDCSHCEKVISQMNFIVMKYRNFVQWNVYFYEPSKSYGGSNESYQKILRLIEIGKSDSKAARISLLTHAVVSDNINISKESEFVLSQMQLAISENKIDYFPFIVFNGRTFPKAFQLDDLDILISDWMFSQKDKKAEI